MLRPERDRYPLRFAQGDPLWARREFAPGHTFGKEGCLVCCLATAAGIEPPEFAALVKFDDQGNLIWASAEPAVPGAVWLGRVDYSRRPYPQSDYAALEVENDDIWVLVQVNAHPERVSYSQHWVLAVARVPDPSASYGSRLIAWDPLAGAYCDVETFYGKRGRGLDYAVWGISTYLYYPVSVVFRGSPAMSYEKFEQVLRAADSPAAPGARLAWEYLVQYRVEPAFALAVFEHESSYGKAGVARETHNWGNLRTAPVPEFADRVEGGWAYFSLRPGEPEGADWARSCGAFARLIARYYVEELGAIDPAQIFPVYAPAEDRNKPMAYAAAVRRRMREWGVPKHRR